MELRKIQQLIKEGQYSIRPHVIRHGLKEGFTKEDVVYTVLNGKIIEKYPERKRYLLYAEIKVTKKTQLPLHVICDYSWPKRIDLVTAYVPDPADWINPWARRR